MADVSDRFLTEARQQVESTKKAVWIVLSAALIWWWANLSPLSFAERAAGTPTSRLNELASFAKDAVKSCDEGTVRDYIRRRYAAARQEPGAECFALKRTGLESKSSRANDDVALTYGRGDWNIVLDRIKSDLDALSQSEKCSKEIEGWRKKNLDACLFRREKLLGFVSELSRQGSLDVFGLKISNIHPKWHPFIFAFLVGAAAAFIAVQRRRIFLLFDLHFIIQGANRSHVMDRALQRPALLTLPWWFYPLPTWGYASGHTYKYLMTRPAEYLRARWALVGIATALAAMFVFALNEQNRISTLRLQTIEQAVAGLQKSSFTLVAQSFGRGSGATPDLFLLALLCFTGLAVFLWISPPVRNRNKLPNSTRRSLLKASAYAATALVASTAVPLAFDAKKTANAATNIFFRVRGRRRHRRPRFRAYYGGSAGWYKNMSGGSKIQSNSLWIGHFVKPALTVEKPQKTREWGRYLHWSNNRLGKITSHLPAGKIAGAGKLRTHLLSPLPDEDLPVFTSNDSRLNLRFYSEGIEFAAIRKWQAGERDAALQILSMGVAYARRETPLNVRLYDLAAGLLTRSGRLEELTPLQHDLDQEWQDWWQYVIVCRLLD
jgi:hypothetical protein